MIEIKSNQELEINNILSFRSKMKQNELDNVIKNMELKIQGLGARRLGNPITATFGIDGEYLDVEILLPVDRPLENMGEYIFKEKFKLVNATVATYKGHPMGLQNACNEFNQHILEQKLQPITVGYNVTKHIDPINMENTEI